MDPACQAAGALRLRAAADLHGVRDDFDGAVGPAIIMVRRSRVRRGQARLDEADRVRPDGELAIACLSCQLPDGLPCGFRFQAISLLTNSVNCCSPWTGKPAPPPRGILLP